MVLHIRYIVLVFYILPLTYSGMKRKVAVNRDQLTLFSALLDPPDLLTTTAQLLNRGAMIARLSIATIKRCLDVRSSKHRNPKFFVENEQEIQNKL